MTLCIFKHLSATASLDRVANRQGGEAGLVARRAAFSPRPFRIVVRPGQKNAAMQVRCRGGQTTKI